MSLKPAYIAVGASFTKQRPAVILPRIVGGVDFGTERKLLAHVNLGTSSRDLIWTPGAKHWKSITAGYVYRPGELSVKWTKDDRGHDWLDSASIGETRLDRLLCMTKAQDWIRGYFVRGERWGKDLIQHLDARSTVTIRPARGSR
jgi:hypothetical protein